MTERPNHETSPAASKVLEYLEVSNDRHIRNESSRPSDLTDLTYRPGGNRLTDQEANALMVLVNDGLVVRSLSSAFYRYTATKFATMCSHCQKPISETGTMLDGKPIHIECFHTAKGHQPADKQICWEDEQRLRQHKPNGDKINIAEAPAQLKQLGSGTTTYSDHYNRDLLEAFMAPKSTNDRASRVVQLHCPEFTSLCPKTGQPDFASIYIEYEPNNHMVESKSLKLYLFSFRSEGQFHEQVIQTIGDDLVWLMEPKWLYVRGEFLPRGGISIWPEYYFGANPSDELYYMNTFAPLRRSTRSM